MFAVQKQNDSQILLDSKENFYSGNSLDLENHNYYLEARTQISNTQSIIFDKPICTQNPDH